ncbi:MAG: tetratricopeptide repeat protein, partial [Bacteroidales bacterium]|nr:tetratricopeptide repeat protein [Bacteroidales bacterium]
YVDNKEGTAYRPIPLMSYAIEIGIFGLKPAVHHFFNILFYTILSLLIYFLLSQFIFPDKNKLLSVFITTLFIIHPLHTEVVSNIKSRDEIFSFLFFVLSIIYLFKYYDVKKVLYWIFSVLFYVLSLFSKENALIYILIIPLFLYFFKNIKLKEISRLILPYVIMLAVFLVVRYIVITGRGAELTYVNNALLIYDGFFESYAVAFYILLLYLKLLIFPYPLLWDYSYGHFEMDNTVFVLAIISFLIYLAMLIYALAGFKKKNIFSFLILFYLLTFSMVSNIFFYIGSTMSDRFLFIPSFAFCIAIMIIAGKVLKINFDAAKPKFKTGSIILFSILFMVFSVYSYSESKQWKNDQTVTIGDYGKTHSFRARMSYVEIMYKKANENRDNREVMNNARVEIRKLLNDFPDEPEVWYMDGIISMAYGDQKSAIESYKKTLSLNDHHLDALNNLGTIYHIDGEYDIALEHYNRILAIDISYYRVYGNIGMIHHFLKDYDKALEYYRISLENVPENEVIQRNYEMVKEKFR